MHFEPQTSGSSQSALVVIETLIVQASFTTEQQRVRDVSILPTCGTCLINTH